MLYSAAIPFYLVKARYTPPESLNLSRIKMTEKTLFSKIIEGEIPADILFQDDRVTAFKDIHPQAPIHILIIPNKPIPSVNEVTVEDEAVLGHLFIVAQKLAKELGIAQSGYRLLINCGDDAGQEVYHLHMHLLGGKRLGKMVTK